MSVPWLRGLVSGPVISQVRQCEIYGRKFGSGTDFFPRVLISSPVNIIPPTLHTHLYLYITLTKRTNGRSLGTFLKQCFFFWKSVSIGQKSTSNFFFSVFKYLAQNQDSEGPFPAVTTSWHSNFFRIHTSLIRRTSGRIIRNFYQGDRLVSHPKPHVSLISSPSFTLFVFSSAVSLYPPLSTDDTYCPSLRHNPLRICKLSWILFSLHLKYKRCSCWQFSPQCVICQTRIRTVNRISI